MGWFKKGRRTRGSTPVTPPTIEATGSLELAEIERLQETLETTVELDLPQLSAQLELQLPRVLEQTVDRVLVHARLADAYREEGDSPMPPKKFLEAAGVLDEEGWRRLALLVTLLDLPDCREGVSELLIAEEATAQVQQAFISFAHDTNLLTVATLRHSELRREEFLRRWLMRLGAGVEGETLAASLERMGRLDYGKLLGEAERARLIAQERMAYLEKLQEAEEASRRPRGKW